MKRIEIIPLALKNMGQRDVPRRWLEETLRKPEQIVAGYQGRKIRQRHYTVHGKPMLLRVVVEEQPDRW